MTRAQAAASSLRRQAVSSVLLLGLFAICGGASADTKGKHQPIDLQPSSPIARPDAQTVLGRSEHVGVMEDKKSVEVTGVLDTSEPHSTLYVTDMKYFSRDYEQWVRFTVDSGNVVSGHVLDIERKVLRDEHVKQKNGSITHRPWVEVNLCIGKHGFTSQLALMDRSAFTAQLRLGSEDIGKIGRVDPSLQFTAQPDCSAPAPPPPAAAASTATP
jgi:hypothetical protein